MTDDEEGGSFASPPCFMHELDPAYLGLGGPQGAEVARWRKSERERLIARRVDLGPARRRELDRAIIAALMELVGPFEGLTVSAYWPFRGEPDLRPFLKTVEAEGGRVALPVVVRKGEALIFRAWSRGEPLTRGVWNIPIPTEAAPEATPEVVIAPLVGFDPAGYRLGYGGGFFDRTLAALPAVRQAIGVGYDLAALPTIYPQWHDIPMTAVVTEAGLQRPRPGHAGD